DRAPCLARKASDNRLVAHEGLGAESSTHRRANDTNPVLWDAEDTSEIHAQVKGRLRAGPDFEVIAFPEGYRSVRFHVGVLCASCSECFFNDHIGVGKALPCITVPDAKAMADVGARLWTQTKVGGIIIRDRVMLVDERRS